MLERTKFEKLFSTPLIRFKVADHETLDKALLEEGNKQRSLDQGASKSNRGGWHSSGNLFEGDAECIKRLNNLAEHSIWQANETIGAKADSNELELKIFAWMNMNPVQGFNAPHTHPGAHWSGVYYVNQPPTESESAGMIEFMAPRTDLPNWRILEASAFRLKKKLRPQAGEIVLFPSYLLHWVYPNESDEERVTIAFNGTFRKKRK